MKFGLIIFDCDGVLVDSEVISCRAHADVLSRHGYPITADQVFERFLGRSTRQANLEIEAELGRKLPDEYHAELQDELFGSFEAGLEAVSGIHDVLDQITQRVCVASSGSPQRMRVSLGSTSLYERLSPNIYRFLPLRLGPQDLERIHGIDERISCNSFVDAIRFYYIIIKNIDVIK